MRNEQARQRPLYIGMGMNKGHKEFDAVIVGGGPAGVSCAIWLARLGFRPALLDAQSSAGGLCRSNPFTDDWNAALPGASGVDVATNLDISLKQAQVAAWFSCQVNQVQATEDGFLVDGSTLDAPLRTRHLVLATGVRARGLAPSGQAIEHSGILTGPGQHIVEQDFQGKRVAVLGGGDNAFENGLYAIEHAAAKVRLYARSVRAQRQFVRKIPAEFVTTAAYKVDMAARTVNGEPYDLILVFYGWEPRTQFAEALGLRRTSLGFIATDTLTAQTSYPGVYAIGEVAQRQHPCVVTALADGVTAAKAIQAHIETSC